MYHHWVDLMGPSSNLLGAFTPVIADQSMLWGRFRLIYYLSMEIKYSSIFDNHSMLWDRLP